MPRVTPVTPALHALLYRQDWVVSVQQLITHDFPPGPAHRRAREGKWQELLSGVLLTVSGTPTRRQLLIAAQLAVGPSGAIDAADACVRYGVRPAGFDPGVVHVVVPAACGFRSRDFLKVRRSNGDIEVFEPGLLRYVDPHTAFVAGARNARTTNDALSLLSRGVQHGTVDMDGLREAREAIGGKGCARLDEALVALGVGIRSPGEKDARDLILTSLILPEPRWNQWLAIDDGGTDVCADSLREEAAQLHEVNGKRAHAWAEQFVDMQARHDRLTAAGLVPMHNAPVRIRRAGPAVLDELERTFLRNQGRGLPEGVRLIDPPLWLRNRSF